MSHRYYLPVLEGEAMIEIGRLSFEFDFWAIESGSLVGVVDRIKDDGFTWFYFFPFHIYWYSKERP